MIIFDYIQSFAYAHTEVIYALIAIGVFLEGEIVVIIAGILSYLGVVNLPCSFIATIFGGAVKSVFGYSFGFYLQNKFSHKKLLVKSESRVNRFFPNFLKKPFWSIFFSRFLILGLYWFTLIYSGYKKINLKLFIRAEILSLIFWAMFMLGLGYFFSHTALSISRDVRNFVIIILCFFIAFLFLEKIISFFVGLFETNDHKDEEHI